MLEALLIIVDEDFGSPIYAEPDPEDLDPDHWRLVREIIVEIYEGDRKNDGIDAFSEHLIGWKMMSRNGLAFVAIVTDDVEEDDLNRYLKALVRTYFDEVDDVRNPERDGVEDVVVEVIPPWDE